MSPSPMRNLFSHFENLLVWLSYASASVFELVCELLQPAHPDRPNKSQHLGSASQPIHVWKQPHRHKLMHTERETQYETFSA